MSVADSLLAFPLNDSILLPCHHRRLSHTGALGSEHIVTYRFRRDTREPERLEHTDAFCGRLCGFANISLCPSGRATV